MSLWSQWYWVVAPLRAACSRQRTFVWLLAALAGISARRDLLGVTSIVRTLGLAARCHDRVLEQLRLARATCAHRNKRLDRTGCQNSSLTHR
jgi:hypothetical protein